MRLHWTRKSVVQLLIRRQWWLLYPLVEQLQLKAIQVYKRCQCLVYLRGFWRRLSMYRAMREMTVKIFVKWADLLMIRARLGPVLISLTMNTQKCTQNQRLIGAIADLKELVFQVLIQLPTQSVQAPTTIKAWLTEVSQILLFLVKELIKILKRSRGTIKAQHQHRLSITILKMRTKMSLLNPVLDLGITWLRCQASGQNGEGQAVFNSLVRMSPDLMRNQSVAVLVPANIKFQTGSESKITALSLR